MFRIRSWRFLTIPGVVLVTFILLSPGSALQSSPDLEKHFLAAQRNQQQGQLDAAIQEYEAVLRLQPDLVEAYVNLGLVYYAQAKYEESFRALSAAAKLKPGMRGVSLWLGIDDVQLHRPSQGAVLLREAIRLDREDKLAQSWLATALWDAGQIDAALLQLRKASARFPDDPDLLFARGEAYGKAASQQMEQLLTESSGTALSDLIYGTHYVEEHDWTKAEGHLRRAVDRAPRMLEVRLELAEAYLQQARVPAAQEQLDQALEMAPRSASALARRGVLLLLQQKSEEGLRRIVQGIAIDASEVLDALKLPVDGRIDQTDHSDAGVELAAMSRRSAKDLELGQTTGPAKDVALAALYALSGDEDASMRTYRQIGAAHSSPSLHSTLLTKAITAMHQHDYEDAEPLLLHWLATNPSDRLARYDLVLVRRQIARSQVVRLLAVAPDSYHVHQLLGEIYVSNEEDDKALTEYLAVAAARPDLPGVHFWLGHLYWKHGDADHARAELMRELELSPGHPEASAELGTVLMAEDRAVEAIPHLELAIHSKPDLWPAYAQLGRAYAAQKHYVRAEEALKHSLAHDPDGSAHYQLGLVLRAQGKTAQADQAFAKVRTIKNEQMASASSVGGGNLESTSPGAKQ